VSDRDPAPLDQELLDAVVVFGDDAVAFQSLESGLCTWRDDPAPAGTGAVVAYADTGTGWVAAGTPLVPVAERARAAERFVAAARAAGRRACFFACEAPAELGDVATLFLGEQPVFRPAEWIAELRNRNRRRLREQLRRVRAKGVRVRPVAPGELAAGSPLRADVEHLADHWLRSRRMEPMRFLVTVEPFHAPEEHRYFAAEKDGRLVAFLSAVPICGRRGWLVEDMLRGPDAPNGTAESMIDALMREVADSSLVTLGLAPLTGPIARWQRAVRTLARPLYDFRGVRAFKERLRPSSWQGVWLAHPPGERTALHLVESLRAFAGGSLVRFGALTALRHPGVPPLLLALPLVPWTAVLAVRALAGMTMLLGWSRAALGAWAVFDALLCAALFRIALKPSPRRLFAAAAAAAADAALSLHHLVYTGFGFTSGQILFRSLQTAAPLFGTAALLWAASRALALARPAPR
jgi:phosphatidylglycerol lysyltransferase